MECRHQPRPGFREFRPGQPTAGQVCSRKVPAVTTPAFITPPKLKVPAHSDPVKRWEFRIADWKGFCLLTGELPSYKNWYTHPGMTLPRRAWVRLNRLRTSVGRFRSCLYKWGMASSAACECGAEEQTVDHVVIQCPIHRPPHGLHGLTVLDDDTTEWLLNTCPKI